MASNIELHNRDKSASKDPSVQDVGDDSGGLHGCGARYTNDERDLIRLGKKPVLKVCYQTLSLFRGSKLTIWVKAELRVHVYLGVFLHRPNYMGGDADVRPLPSLLHC